MVIQILITLASSFVIVKSAIAYLHKAIRLPTFLLWSVFWAIMIFLVWQPNLADRLAALLQVGRGADAVFYISLISIFYLLFRVMIRFEHLDMQLTTLIRELAILKKEVEEIKK